MRNILAKAPNDIWSYLEAVRDAPNYDEGRKRAQEVIASYPRSYPSAIAGFSDDLEASLAHLKLPAPHRKYVRKTNLIERSFEGERRQSKVIPMFFNERSYFKLVFSVLWRSSMRRQSVRIKDVEKVQFDFLRKSLGLIPESSVSITTKGFINMTLWLKPGYLRFYRNNGTWPKPRSCHTKIT